MRKMKLKRIISLEMRNFLAKVMREAHALTSELRKKYDNINYHAQLGLCMKYFFEELKGATAPQEPQEIITSFNKKGQLCFMI